MGQLEDPLGIVFNRASLGYDVGTNLLPSMVDSSCFVEVRSVKCYDDVLVSKRHAKWVAHLHINMTAVDVHK